MKPLDELILPSFAKINLVLRVLNRRRDGYHALETVFQTIGLHDVLTFRFFRSSRLHLVLDMGDSSIPADSLNLIWKACHVFDEEYPIRCKIEIEARKLIPSESGLGGGSSNGAVTLIALSRFLGWPLNRRKLISLARKLGSDIPFFLFGGTALGEGRGDRITQLEDWPSLHTLIVCPEVGCSTAEVYRKLDESGFQKKRSFLNYQRPKSIKQLAARIENDLEPVVLALYPELNAIKKKLHELGAVTAALTGSGSAIFGLFRNKEELEQASHHFSESYRTRFVSHDEYAGVTGSIDTKLEFH